MATQGYRLGGTLTVGRFSGPRWTVLFVATLLALLTGCSGATSTGVSSPAPTTSAVSTTSSTPTTTSVAKPGLPTYSEVVATYPGGVDKCDSVLNLAGTRITVTAGSLHLRTGKWEKDIACYGTKITVTQSASVEGTTYKAGTKLTVDAKMNLVPVSSWD
jgi:hypothetical protein